MHADFFFHRNLLLVRETAQGGFQAAAPDNAADFPAVEDCPVEGGIVAVHDVPSPESARGDALRWMDLREIYDLAGPGLYALATIAFQVLHWRRTFRFCGKCGAPLARKANGERAMRCEACGMDYFPRINPAVIVRIVRGDRLLLATRKTEYRGGVIWGLIAGFVEAGESLEQAVAREIREEVGLEVTDVRYVLSQPWSFPNNLMLGFEARCDAGEIRPDGVEVKEARWFGRDDLPPNLPARMSIARRLIDSFFRDR